MKKYSDEYIEKQSSGVIQLSASHSNDSGIRLEYPNGVVLNLRTYPGNKALLELINLAQ
ncbi:MAG: hypothetical protein IPM34_12600 [Saprospiraceae bacterium]|nr:hypothetical protein [Saprospiraceae bacterium]